MSQELSIYLEGEKKAFMLDYQELTIKGEFNNVSNQASLQIERIALINESAQFVREYIEQGNIYEGLEISLVFKQFDEELIALDGFLDLTEDYEEIDPFFKGENNANVVYCSIKDLSARDTFRDQIEGVSYDYLESKGVFKKNDYQDIDFKIEEDFEPLKYIFLLFMFFSIIDKIQVLIENIAKTVADISARASQVPAGPVVALAYSVAILILQVAYFAFLVLTLFDIFYQIITVASSPIFTNKGQSLHSLIKKAVNYLGYEFNTELNILKDIYYMPSLPFDSQNFIEKLLPFPALVEKGLPSTDDFGYFVDQMISIVLQTFNCKLAVIDSVVNIHNVSSDFWYNSSSVKLPDVKLPSKRNNSGDLSGTNTFSFATDIAESWTIRDNKNKGVEIKTTVKTPRKSSKYDLIKGLNNNNSPDIPCALMSRKDSLNVVEKLLKLVAESIDDLAKIAKGDTDLASLITDKIGVGKMSTSNTTVPKLVYLKNGRIPANHRDILGAKAIWEEYHKSKSFTADNYKAQKDVYLNVENIPFDLAEFKKLVLNSKITTFDNKEADVIDFEYKFPLNFINMSYETSNIFTKNLKEEYL